MTLVDIFQNSVKRYRDLPAVMMRPRYRLIRWTYGDLWNFAAGVAELLEKEGVKRGDPVLLWSPNSPYWVGAFFGILLRGGVVVPLHAENTPEFIQKVAAQTGAKIILKSSQLKFVPAGVKTIDIDALSLGQNPKPHTPYPIPPESDLAEIVYTSGTTGDPKGVMLTHENIVSNIEGLAKAIESGPHDRFLSILPLSHMFEQVAGMLFPIFCGARIIYLPRVASGLITKTLREHRVTKLLAVPQFLDTVMKKIEVLAEEEGKGKSLARARRLAWHLPFWLRRLLFYKVQARLGGRLTTVASGGAPLDPLLEKKWELLGVHLLQGYGLTETSPIASVNTHDRHRFGSIGKPLDKVEIKIAPDKEILVKGPNVFKGYYRNEAKTREAFTNGGPSTELRAGPFGTWFKTGDMGEFDADGFLYIRGRKKYLILGPGGQNVYPEDIEFELAKHPGVRDSAVVGIEKDHHTEIHAVLLLENDAKPEAVIEEANRKLASFQKIQNYSVWPEADFPRSATRKVQKEKVLNWLQKKEKKEIGLPQRPVTPLVSLLGQIFEKEPALIEANMKLVADFGLDSILRIELVTRIEEMFGVTVEERTITPETSVSELEAMIQQAPRLARPKELLKKWPFGVPARTIRELSYWMVIFPFVSTFVRPKIFGQEVFQGLRGPLLIMPNHRSYIDSPMILRALPRRIRRQAAFAAAADVMRQFWWVAPFLELFYASFPFPREEKENIEPGLEAIGKLLDRGWVVVVYPEGRQSPTRNLLPLKRGAGLLGVEMEVPVIPVFMDGTEYVLPRDKIFPRSRGEVRIYFGRPLYFKKTGSYIEVTERIERALHELKRHSRRAL